MAKLKISAEEVLNDLYYGMDNSGIMQKYELSRDGLHSLFRKLLQAGLMTQAEFEMRTQSPEEPAQLVWKCPSCRMPQTKVHEVCPQCGVIVSKFTKQEPEQDQRNNPPDVAPEISSQPQTGGRPAGGALASKMTKRNLVGIAAIVVLGILALFGANAALHHFSLNRIEATRIEVSAETKDDYVAGLVAATGQGDFVITGSNVQTLGDKKWKAWEKSPRSWGQTIQVTRRRESSGSSTVVRERCTITAQVQVPSMRIEPAKLAVRGYLRLPAKTPTVAKDSTVPGQSKFMNSHTTITTGEIFFEVLASTR